MKIDRLLGITCHLLSRESVSARQLAERFGVSPRTIQRDIVSLSSAGIPVMSTLGSGGGYAIMREYRLGQLASGEDWSHIAVALRALCSAYDGKGPRDALEKLLALPGARQEPGLTIDLSASREHPAVDAYLPCIEAAVRQKQCLSFSYVNVRGTSTARVVEPLLLRYQWYAWYLFAYDRDCGDYRLFKVVRMRDVVSQPLAFSRIHDDPETLMNAHEISHPQPCTPVLLRCKASARAALYEYLRGQITEELPGGDFLYAIQVVPEERMWWGLLLSFGDAVTVLSPESLIQRVATHAKEIAAVYGQ